MTRVAIVAVLYESQAVLSSCMVSWWPALDAGDIDAKLYLIDNGPQPHDLRCLNAQWGDDLWVEISLGNPGFAAGCNLAVSQVPDEIGNLLLLNPDVVLSPSSALAIAAFAKENECGRRAAALTLRRSGESYAGITWSKLLNFRDRPAESIRPVYGPSGGGAILPTLLAKELGPFYSPYFAWGEDADLAFRLCRRGVPTVILAEPCPHVGGHSVQSLRGQRLKGRLLIRNRMLFWRRALSTPLFILLSPIFALELALLVMRGVGRHIARARLLGVLEGLVLIASDRVILLPERLDLAEWLRETW